MTIKPCKNCLFDLCGTLVDIHANEEAPSFRRSVSRLPGRCQGLHKIADLENAL